MTESEHFTWTELECACGCGECLIDERLLPALEKLRTLANAPLTITCAYRCSKHNADARGVSKLAHLQGRAADLKVPGLSLQQLYDLAEQVPEFSEGGIGIYDNGTIHVDVRFNRARWALVHGLYVSIAASGLLERW